MEKYILKISIIMPVYNSGKYLSTAVDSILNQSFKEIELILVDDGSTDGSSEKCDEYARKDSRVVVIHQKNGGICNARNTALNMAKAKRQKESAIDWRAPLSVKAIKANKKINMACVTLTLEILIPSIVIPIIRT